MDTQTDQLTELIKDASAILVMTGAGVSTASGIPDFRGPNGIWNTMRPVTFDRFLRDDRSRVEYWDQKLLAAPVFRDARPNAVHAACVELEQAGRLDMLVTQNVDGLHAEAGTTTGHLVEVHGNAMYAVCLSCGTRSPIEPHIEAFAETKEPPVCEDCGGFLKPATISFGQQLEPRSMLRATMAAETCDLVIALGSTLSVYPAADIPYTAVQRGVPYVIINMGATDHDDWEELTLRIDGDVTEVFPSAVRQALAT
jgi:NAD-dependent protein deacetylase/lipoamidase